MKKLLIVIAVVAVAAAAQNPFALTAKTAGVYVASAYDYGRGNAQGGTVISQAGSAGTSYTITLATGQIALANGGVIYPFSITAPITVLDANPETVTPSAVSGCSSGSPTNSCQITASFTYSHGQGATVASGSYGLAEAVADAQSDQGGVVVVDAKWRSDGGTLATVAGIVSGAGVSIVNDGGVQGGAAYYAWKPLAVTQVLAPAAPTLTKVSGALTSGSYYVSAEYVDAQGGISLASTSNNQVTSATGVSVASPAAATGAVGWIPLITAASGSDNTEIAASDPLNAGICTLTTAEAVTPACALGSAASIIANPSGTSKEVSQSSAFATYGYAGANLPPQPMQTVYTIGAYATGSTVNNSAEDLAQWVLPAGYLGGSGGFTICAKIATATQVASSVPVIKLEASPHYGQSSVAISTITFATQTESGAGTISGCWHVNVVSPGGSGTLFADSTLWTNTINSTPHQTVSGSTDVTTAASAAVKLTAETFWAVNFGETAGDNITAPVVTQLTITPDQ